MSSDHRPLALIILDGWGYSDNPNHNAIYAANTPVWDGLWQRYPHMLINASSEDVGLPSGQMGNSEVGHLNMGAGRVVHQDITHISHAISSGAFFSNIALTNAIDLARDNNKAIHIIGLLSPGGVHSHETHIHAMIEMAARRKATHVYVHAFLDGRDTPPKSAQASIVSLAEKFKQFGCGQFASLIGRFYAMDRDSRWQRVAHAYHLITEGEADYHAPDALTALNMAYERGETDEFVKATSIANHGAVKVNDGDVMIFMNFRSDRARQLTGSFVTPDFEHFARKRTINLANFVTLTEYKEELACTVAFPPKKLNNVLGAYISSLGLRQLRIAETEKYAHVTFFFNGGQDVAFTGEDRILVPSPDVDTYDLKPSMHANEVTDKLVGAILNKPYDLIICNFANADMVGHSGHYAATIEAIETLDNCLGLIWSALKKVGGEMIITADHGNAELMLDDKTGAPYTAHTENPVPFIYAGRSASCAKQGSLSNIAPTILSLMGLPIPNEMNNHVLVNLR